MRRVVLCLSALVCVAATSASIAWAATSGGTRTPALTRSVHLVQFYRSGPAVSYSGSAAWASRPGTLVFRLPAQADTYVATITLSFQYRTSGQGHYFVTPSVDFGARGSAAVTPGRRELAPSSASTASTMVYKAVLHPGIAYSLGVEADVTVAGLGSASLDTRSLLVEVEAWPTG